MHDGQRIFCSGITTAITAGPFAGYAKIARDYTAEELREKKRDGALLEEQGVRARLS